MSLEFERYVIVTKVKNYEEDVTKGRIYKVVEADEAGCLIIDDVEESQFMFWEQVERINWMIGNKEDN